MKRALLVRAGALGDVLLLRRAVFALRRAGYECLLLAPRGPGSALVGPGESEAASLIDLDGPQAAPLFDEHATIPPALAQELRDFDLALACSRNAALQAHLGRLIPHVVTVDPAPPPGRNAARWYADALSAAGIDAGADPPPLLFTEDQRSAAQDWLARLPAGFLALHPGSGAEAKNWPADRFAALARSVSPGRSWLVVAGPADQAAAAPLASEPGAVCARELPLRVLGAVLAEAGLFVGNDSGVSHLAAAAGAPTLALFGPTDPAQWAAEGPTVKVLRAPDAKMDGLGLDEVLALSDRVSARRTT